MKYLRKAFLMALIFTPIIMMEQTALAGFKGPKTQKKFQVQVNGGAGSGRYLRGERVYVRTGNSRFLCWTIESGENAVSIFANATDRSFSFLMPRRSVELTARSNDNDCRGNQQDDYRLNVIDGSGDGYYYEGDIVTITADSSSDRSFDQWKVIGEGYIDFEPGYNRFDEKARIRIGRSNIEIQATYRSSGRSKMIVLEENNQLCLGVPSMPRAGDQLELRRCDTRDDNQLWNFNSPSKLSLAAHDNLCVFMPYLARGSAVKLHACGPHQDFTWYYNSNSANEITNRATTQYCLTYRDSSPRPGSLIQLDRCNNQNSQAWFFTTY